MMPYKPKRGTQKHGAWSSSDWGSNNDGWGTTAPSAPCVCASKTPKLKTSKKNVEDEAQSSDSDEGTEESFDGILERKEHYLIREQIWYEGTQRWFPYDASRYEISVPEQDLGNYFYVNIRHVLPGDEGMLVLTNFSDTLVKFLRTTYGDEFYDDSPERSADSLLPDIPILQAKLKAIKLHLSAESTESNLTDKRAFAASLGCQEAKKATHPESHVDQFLKEAQEHMSVLMDYLLELYKPKAEKLALQLSDGCIEFELLVFYFELNQRYCLESSNIERARGFRLESREYDGSKLSLQLSGSAYHWDGESYSETPVHFSIAAYRGTKDLGSLSCQPLTPETRGIACGTGEIVHGAGRVPLPIMSDRIIIDRTGYDDQEGYVREGKEEIPDFPDENLWLLPGSVFGFNLTKKVLIKSLVQVTRNSNTTSNIISDVITGKGGGLICVLHGPPGTGKTLTAEAVAEHLKRPLYIVGTSELSTNPSVLEEKLKSILSLATAWDAVLLLDEADVFLEQRSLHEIERNSLVSVALRVLEYHRGVLFLTTNRIKTFDVAFLSRFSIAIKYPEHDLHSRRIIWRKFFELAGVKTADADGSGRSTPTDMVMLDNPAKVASISDAELDVLAEKPFNGRTIKNLVRTAQALALSSNEIMSKAHVDIVVKSQEKFLREFATV